MATPADTWSIGWLIAAAVAGVALVVGVVVLVAANLSLAEKRIQRRIEPTRAGAPVHVLLDWVGSQPMEASILQRLTDSGVTADRFHPPRWPHLTRLNNRIHRKLPVVDGRVGFTGGVGIADDWSGDADPPDHRQDVHYRLEGPVVAQLQAAFLDNWIKARGELLHGDRYFPAL
jgi:cardiolipin synthase